MLRGRLDTPSLTLAPPSSHRQALRDSLSARLPLCRAHVLGSRLPCLWAGSGGRRGKEEEEGIGAGL